MASKRTEKWKKHHMEMTHGAWYLPFKYGVPDIETEEEHVSGSLGYCTKCKLVYDSIQVRMKIDGKKINTRKFYYYHYFPNLVKDSKYRTCYRCLGKPCKVVDRI